MRNISAIYTAAGIALIWAVFNSLSVAAQTSQPAGETPLRLITSPLPINLVTEPGHTVTAQLKVKNDGAQQERLTVRAMKFTAHDETGAPQLFDMEEADDFARWVSFSEREFTIAPNEWKTVDMTIAVPDAAAFGYYYAIVFARASNVQKVGERQTALEGGTSVLVLLDVAVPGAKREVSVEEFSTDKTVYEFLPATFRIKLKNTGTVHVAPRGNIFLSRGSDKDVALLEVNPAKGNILPDSARIFEQQWTDGFPLLRPAMDNGAVVKNPDGTTAYDLTWDFSQAAKLRWGKYTARLLLVYDDGSRDVPIEGAVSFWVMPWRILAGILIVALFMFIGLNSTLQKMWRNIFHKQ